MFVFRVVFWAVGGLFKTALTLGLIVWIINHQSSIGAEHRYALRQLTIGEAADALERTAYHAYEAILEQQRQEQLALVSSERAPDKY